MQYYINMLYYVQIVIVTGVPGNVSEQGYLTLLGTVLEIGSLLTHTLLTLLL